MNNNIEKSMLNENNKSIDSNLGFQNSSNFNFIKNFDLNTDIMNNNIEKSILTENNKELISKNS